MFTKKDYGRVLSKKLTDALKRRTTGDDQADASVLGECSPSLIRQLLDRKTNLTENGSKGMEATVEIAIKNCENTIAQAKKDKKYFESLK